MSDNMAFYTPNKAPHTTVGFNLWLGTYPNGPWTAPTEYTGTITSLYDRDRNTVIALTATGAADPLRSVVFEMSLSSATNISFFALQNGNFANFDLRINSATSYSYTGAIGNKLAEIATIAATTIEIQVFSLNTGASVSLGQFIVGEKVLELPHNPNYADYTPLIKGNREPKEMADGGEITYQVAEKFSADIKLNYVPESTTTEFKAMWDSNTSYNFVPFPTTTSWNGDIHDVNWSGNYEFQRLQRNQRSTPYFTGTMRLRETPL